MIESDLALSNVKNQFYATVIGLFDFGIKYSKFAKNSFTKNQQTT